MEYHTPTFASAYIPLNICLIYLDLIEKEPDLNIAGGSAQLIISAPLNDPAKDSSDDDGPTTSTCASSEVSCKCPCCCLEPHQPVDKKTLAHTTKTYGGVKQKKRTFQTQWYKMHPWLSLCSTKGKVFCSTCMEAKAKDLLTFSTKADSAFISTGFQN